MVGKVRTSVDCRTRAWFAWSVLISGLFICVAEVSAQSPRPTAISVMGGPAFRGLGNIGACCGPFQPDLEEVRSFWVGGGLSRDIARSIAVDAEVTWTREPAYKAYVQAAFGDVPYQGYAADNRISSFTTAALFRWHTWRRGTAVVGLTGGLAWVHERRASHLRSVVFRPTPNSPSLTTLDIADNRDTGAAALGVDVERSNGRFAIFAQGRGHLYLSGNSLRSDLDLGRKVWRLGIGARTRF